MNCCCLIILLLLLGNGNSSSCGSTCIEPRRRTENRCQNNCNSECSDLGNNCTRTQTVITRTECDTDSCQMNMTSDSMGNNRYPTYNMNYNDCGCHD